MARPMASPITVLGPAMPDFRLVEQLTHRGEVLGEGRLHEGLVAEDQQGHAVSLARRR